MTRAERTILGKDNSPKAQMDFFASVIDGHHDGVVILDVELANDYSTNLQLPKQLITDSNMECWEIAKKRYDEVLFYSRADFLNSYMAYDERFKLLDLWLADYGTNNGTWHGLLYIPKGCAPEQVVLQQYTDKGTAFCCGSLNIDLNIVINDDRFAQIFNLSEVPSGYWDEERIAAIEESAEKLHKATTTLQYAVSNAVKSLRELADIFDTVK